MEEEEEEEEVMVDQAQTLRNQEEIHHPISHPEEEAHRVHRIPQGGMDLTEVEVTLQTKDPLSLKEREKSRNQLSSTGIEPRQKSSLTNSSYSLREDHTISLPTIPKFLQHFPTWKEEL